MNASLRLNCSDPREEMYHCPTCGHALSYSFVMPAHAICTRCRTPLWCSAVARDGVLVLKVRPGQAPSVADIDKLLEHCEPESSLDRVICDLSDLEAVSSGLIAGLVVLSKRIRAAGGRLIVCGMHGVVRDVFSRLHLDRAIELADDQDQAAVLLDGALATAGIGL